MSCLESMYRVNLMMKMCQVVIRQREGYTQDKPEVVDYMSHFVIFAPDPESVCSKKSFEEITSVVALLKKCC